MIREVKQITYQEAKPWILKKHYAKRIPSISYVFGLYIEDKLSGVCSFGYPPNYNYNNGKCIFYTLQILTLELNRLIINDGLPKNTLSQFVANSLKLLPSPSVIVSYADPNNGHHGYIYQATNWIYTGPSTPKHRYTFANGETFDIRRGIDKKGEIVKIEKLLPTYRYLFFNGDKRQIKQMKRELKMNNLPYPKGDNQRYDSGDDL